MEDAQSSPELIAITKRWINALATCDPDTIQNLFSNDVSPHYCGTDLGEVWSGQFLRDKYPHHMADAPKGGFVVDGKTTACETHPGVAGWSFWEGNLRTPPPTHDIHLRASLFFVCFKGVWSIAHAHCSIPSSNADNYGWEHQSMNAVLAELQQQGFVLNQPGTSTIMFTDVANSTALNHSMGDISWTRTIRGHIDAVTSAIESEGGVFIKSLGDGTMSVFSDAQNAVAAAQAIQSDARGAANEHDLKVRIGIHTGNVVQTENDYFGKVVNTAARITAVAGAGEIRISSTSQSYLDSDVTVDDPVTMELKGLEGEFTLLRVPYI